MENFVLMEMDENSRLMLSCKNRLEELSAAKKVNEIERKLKGAQLELSLVMKEKEMIDEAINVLLEKDVLAKQEIYSLTKKLKEAEELNVDIRKANSRLLNAFLARDEQLAIARKENTEFKQEMEQCDSHLKGEWTPTGTPSAWDTAKSYKVRMKLNNSAKTHVYRDGQTYDAWAVKYMGGRTLHICSEVESVHTSIDHALDHIAENKEAIEECSITNH